MMWDSKNMRDRRKNRILTEIRDWIIVIVAALAITFLLRTFICDFPIVDGNSMIETLQSGERMAVTKIDLRFSPLQRGEVVVCYYPETVAYGDMGLLVKRIVAVGGDTVAINNEGQLVVNGEIIDEPYIEHSAISPFAEVTVPEDHYFVMGDNRPTSLDSRAVGPLPADKIEGRVHAVFWPLSEMRWIEKHTY